MGGSWDSKPVHEHDLILRDKGEGDDGGALKKCGGCGEKIRGDNKASSSSSYYWYCTLCEYCFHEGCAKLPLQIKHFFHPCPLFLHSSPGFICNSCFGSLDDVYTYHCEQCDFDMCVECATREVPSSLANCQHILHCCHPHPLQPLIIPFKSNSLSLSCEICDMPCSSTLDCWGCKVCNFHIHKSCLDFLPETVQLKLRSLVVASWVLQTCPTPTCTDCDKTIYSNLFFQCRVGEETSQCLCIFCYLLRRLIGDDKPSSQVPKFIDHFFHPCPDLKLVLSPPESSTCNACFLSHHQFSYHCDSCDFFLCFDCSQLPQLASHENEPNQLVQHFCHWHPLKLFTGMGDRDTNHICNLCERFCLEPFYSCTDQCQFYIHKSCMDSLPHKTNHLLLNQTIVLRHVPSFECTTCNRQRSGLTFYCSEIKCKFCIKCVLWPENVLGDDGRFKSIHHWHQLSLHETRIEDKRRTCYLCKERCIGGTWSYKCSQCALFYLHKSCAELPAQLEHHLIHPQHHLTLTKRSSSDMTCKLCLKNLSLNFPLFDWVYQCQQCGFQLDTQCATNCLPSVEYKGHPHLLYVVVNMHGNTNCQVCGESCKGFSTLHCADQECDGFSLHLLCGPLPRTIKHALHVHPLALRDYYVEDNGSDEFACHICEEERDPRLRVYCCSQGCLMICDVKCVLNEVLPWLRGERGEVELRTPYPQVACRVIHSNKSVFAEIKLNSTFDGAGDGNLNANHVFSLDELLDSVSIWDEDEAGDQEIDAESIAETEASSASEESSGSSSTLEKEVQSYSFSWKALSRFKKLLHTSSDNVSIEEKFLKQYDGSITIGDYELPEILGPIFDEFFGTHNIIDHKCKLNYANKRALIFVTCCVLHQMRMTKVVDVTKETILQWLYFIRGVQEKFRFNVGFVAKNMKQVWEAHYYIQAKKIVDDKTARLEREIEQVSMYEAELRTKMDEAQARHRELKLMEKEHETYRVVGSRGPMKKVRSDALEIKWRTCYESLVTRPWISPPE